MDPLEDPAPGPRHPTRVTVLLAGGLEIDLKKEVIESLSMLGDPSLEAEIVKEAVAMGLEEKLGGTSVRNVRNDSTVTRYYAETHMEGMLYRLRSIMQFMDRAENLAEKSVAAAKALQSRLADDLEQAIQDKDWDRVAAVTTLLRSDAASLLELCEGIVITDAEVKKVEAEMPTDVSPPELHHFSIPDYQPFELNMGRQDEEGSDASGEDPTTMGYTQLSDGGDSGPDSQQDAPVANGHEPDCPQTEPVLNGHEQDCPQTEPALNGHERDCPQTEPVPNGHEPDPTEGSAQDSSQEQPTALPEPEGSE
ncbi:hypothetical protein DIPPA_20672 [Diplonema papillatum]|nr:hypothetical protein DIPPA_20672 [Diplonema papillatum]